MSSLPSGCHRRAVTRDVANQAIMGTKAAGHFKRIDQFGGAGNIDSDRLVADRTDPNGEAKPSCAMPRKFNKTIRAQRALKHEAGLFEHDRHESRSRRSPRREQPGLKQLCCSLHCLKFSLSAQLTVRFRRSLQTLRSS